MKKLTTMSILTMISMSSIAFADCSLIEAKSGWTGSVEFSCDQDTDLLKNPISFDITNGVNVSSIWGLPGNSQMTQNGNTISVTVKKWWPDEAFIAEAGTHYKLSFSPSTNQFEITNFNVGGSAQTKGSISIQLPEKPSYIPSSILPTVQIFRNDVKIIEMTNANWGTTKTFEVNVSNDTDTNIEVRVIGIDGATGIATPATFTLAEGQNQEVDVSYNAPKPAEVGSIKITASAPDTTTQSPAFELKDSDDNVVKQGTLNLSQPIVIDDIPASENGVSYRLEVQSYIDNGAKYTPKAISNIVVTNFNTTNVDVSFTKEALPTEKVAVTVTGLPDGHNATLTLQSDNGTSQEITLNGNKTYNIEVPKDGSNYTIIASSFDDYRATITPSNSFVANQASIAFAINYKQEAPIESNGNTIGYWENWKGSQQAPSGTSNSEAAYYSNDVAPYSHVFYSFLTLAKSPNPDSPANTSWDGSAIYESMTASDVLSFMQQYPEGTPLWKRENNWMRLRVDALIEAVHNNNAKFIWAIGGWSDIQQTIRPDQIDKFTDMIVDLLKVSGDGVDFDWEHLSQLANGNVNPNKQEQLETLAETMKVLREKLDAAGMKDKEIGYTTRFNAFMSDSSQYGFAGFNSDGEGITIDNWLKNHGSSLNAVADHVNIMAYDVGPTYMPNNQTWTQAVYEDVLNSFSQRVDKNKINLGFEPGGQAAGGIWEGFAVDKEAINYLAENNYGGSMFWAINQPPYNSSENTGLNSDILAKYTIEQFADEDK